MSLEITNLEVSSDGRQVVHGVSVSVNPGEVTAILGPNGAGKSELVLAVAGLLTKEGGQVVVGDQDITHKDPATIRAHGVAAVPEGHQVLAGLSVDDNLRAAGSTGQDPLRERLDDVYSLFPELAERKSQIAGSMSGGQQQMLAIGHALMARPKYLLLDEMSLGLAPVIVTRLVGVVKELVKQGAGIILIEQFTEVALSVADRAIVLRQGKVQYDGAPDVLQQDPALLKNLYFG